jgi:hypothetical protein
MCTVNFNKTFHFDQNQLSSSQRRKTTVVSANLRRTNHLLDRLCHWVRSKVSYVPRPRPASSPGSAHHNAENAPSTCLMAPQQRFTSRNDDDSEHLNAVDFPAYSPPEVNTKIVRKSHSFDSAIAVESNKTNAPEKAKNSKPKESQVPPVAKQNPPPRRVVDI